MAVNDLLPQYVDALRRFGKLRYERKKTGSATDHVTEADKRLNQVHYWLRRFSELESEHDRVDAEMAVLRGKDSAGYNDRATRLHEIGYELEAHGEAFYYFAWRLCGVLRRVNGFGGFEAAGVREVRNALIEHPEKRRGVLNCSFVFDCSEGLILKPWGGGSDRVHDRGLYANAKDLAEELSVRLANLGF